MSFLEKTFKLSEHKTTVRTEVMAGITTFFAMAYIIMVNPGMLADPAKIMGDAALAQQISNSVFFATCLSAFVGTLLMGLLAKIPFAQASGMGLNAFFAYTVMLNLGKSYAEALAIVFISGVLFIIITVCGIREAIVKAIPKNVRFAISGGIGLFIAFIGLKNAGIIVSSESTFISLVDFTALTKSTNGLAGEDLANLMASKLAVFGAIIAIVGLIIIGALYAKKIKGSVLIGIVASGILYYAIGIPTGLIDTAATFGGFSFNFVQQAKDFVDVGLFSCFTDGFPKLFTGGNIAGTIVQLIVIVLSFSLVDMFDTIGTLLGTAKKANLLKEDGTMENMKQALLCDAIATTAGAMLGTSTVTTYVESSAGIGEGGRTGLTSVVTAVLFLVSLVIGPFIGLIPSCATAPALIAVGAMMIAGVKDLNFEDFDEAVPAFLTIAMMPLSYSIANGIAFGLISYVLIKLFTGKVKEINWLTAVLAALFIIRFFLMAM